MFKFNIFSKGLGNITTLPEETVLLTGKTELTGAPAITSTTPAGFVIEVTIGAPPDMSYW